MTKQLDDHNNTGFVGVTISNPMKTGGFTLIEIMLSLAVIALIGGITAPLYRSYFTRNELSVAHNRVAQTIRQAQTYARAVEQDSPWGVYVTDGQVTLFAGSGYDSRDEGLDITHQIRDSISVSGDREYVFSKLFGRLGQQKETTLTLPSGTERAVRVNAVGTVTYP